jgi:hypothetical protein
MASYLLIFAHKIKLIFDVEHQVGHLRRKSKYCMEGYGLLSLC